MDSSFVNVLVIGEKGTGKTTWINSVADEGEYGMFKLFESRDMKGVQDFDQVVLFVDNEASIHSIEVALKRIRHGKVIIVLNKIDLIEGVNILVDLIENMMDIKCIPICATSEKGVENPFIHMFQ